MGSSTNRPTSVKPRSLSGISFRSRLTLGNMLIVAIAVAGTALVILYRAQLVNTFLGNQITDNVRQLTETELTSTASRHADELDKFFVSIGNNMSILSTTLQSMLAQEKNLTGLQWDARQSLFRLSQGSWSNSSVEPGSIFLPAQKELSNPIVSELNTIKQLDIVAPSVLTENPDMIALYFGSEQGTTLYYPNVELASILPPDFDVTQRPWFLAATVENDEREIKWSAPYQDAALNGLVVTCSLPVYDDKNRFRGVIAADLQLTKISELISSISVAQSGYAFLIDGEGRIIVMPENGYSDLGLNPADFQGEQALEPIFKKVPLDVFPILSRMTTHQSGMRAVELNGVEKYIAYYPIPSIGYSLGIVVPVSETQGALVITRKRLEDETRNTLTNIIIGTIILLAGSLLISRWMGNTLAKPLVQLTDTATRLADGDLSAEAQSRSRDEIGVLANAFNVMTSRLRDLVSSLEQRVAERTTDLEQATLQSKKRAEELQVVSEVARAVSTEVNLEDLLTLVTKVISERFGFYHVGVFLLDTINQNAVLRASNSPGGKRMTARGHKLSIGQVGIVGHVAATGEARIALDVGADATFFNNPDLPETRSEMALPLSVRGHIIGVLDVQSTQPKAFTQADVETLSTLADQVAIAIENARLLAESRQALEESQALYGDYIGRVWERKTAQAAIGYQHSAGIGRMVDEPVKWEEVQAAFNAGRPVISEGKDALPAVAVPIRLQNRVIGILDIRSPEADRVWTDDEVAIIEAVAERLALALENARLFEETSGRASREHAVAEITSKIRETNDPQVMIRTAIEELQRALKVNRVEIIPQVVSAHLSGRENG